MASNKNFYILVIFVIVILLCSFSLKIAGGITTMPKVYHTQVRRPTMDCYSNTTQYMLAADPKLTTWIISGLIKKYDNYPPKIINRYIESILNIQHNTQEQGPIYPKLPTSELMAKLIETDCCSSLFLPRIVTTRGSCVGSLLSIFWHLSEKVAPNDDFKLVTSPKD